jgi:phosphoribosylformylglycinamidine cyclo-ligase
VLHKYYGEKYPETFEPSLSDDVVYIGKNKFTDEIENSPLTAHNSALTIGKLLLSPTRTYAPLLKVLLEKYFDKIDGIIHCSGGGQTKCMKYLPQPLKIIKDNLFSPPEIFNIIQQNSGADDKEMYQVFNMGHRIEIFTDDTTAVSLIDEARQFNIEAQIVGRTEAAAKKALALHVNDNIISY